MRIAIVNDMKMAVESLRRIIVSRPEHVVAWVALNGRDAVERCERDTPDLILMDLIMPEMNGVEATREIMAGSPCPIVVVTSSVTDNVSLVFEAMGAGALDAVSTPMVGPTGEGSGKDDLLKKINTIERLSMATRHKPAHQFHESASLGVTDRWLLAIGASTGGPGALASVLSRLPKDLPAATVIVQHVDEHFTPGLVQWLNTQSNLPVRLAREGDRLTPGEVLVAATNDHLYINDDGCLGYKSEPVRLPYRPSVDVFFDSILGHWSGKVCAALLTGMGKDGADGLLRLRRHGAYTVAQNAETCKVYGMPKAAVEMNAAVDVLPVDDIADALSGRILGQPPKCRKMRPV